MQLIRDTFVIRADKDLHKTLSINGHDGKPLVVDTDFRKYENATQIGYIESAPLEVSDKYKNDQALKKGDLVFFHHFVVRDLNQLDQDLFRCDYFHLFCKIENGQIKPLEDFIFVEPILEAEEKLKSGSFFLKLERESVKGQGKVFAVNDSAKKQGIIEGDTVFFTKDADYEIEILGKKLWRMRTRNIIGIEKDGELVCLSDKLIVKEMEEEKKESSFILKDEEKRERKGVVVKYGSDVTGVSEGCLISYFYGVSGKLDYKGSSYSFINKSNINYIVQ